MNAQNIKPEIWKNILSKLTPKDVLGCSQVCKKFKELVDSFTKLPNGEEVVNPYARSIVAASLNQDNIFNVNNAINQHKHPKKALIKRVLINTNFKKGRCHKVLRQQPISYFKSDRSPYLSPDRKWSLDIKTLGVIIQQIIPKGIPFSYMSKNVNFSFSKNSRWLALLCNESENITLFDLSLESQYLKPELLLGQKVNSFEFSKNSRYLMAISTDLKKLIIKNLEIKNANFKLKIFNQKISIYEISPNGRYFAACLSSMSESIGDNDNLKLPAELIILDTDTDMQKFKYCKSNDDCIEDLEFSPNSHWLIAIQYFDLHTHLIKIEEENCTLFQVSINESRTFSENGQWLVYIFDNKILLTHLGQKLRDFVLYCHDSALVPCDSFFYLSPDSCWLLIEQEILSMAGENDLTSTSVTTDLRLWLLADPKNPQFKIIKNFGLISKNNYCFSPDSKRLFVVMKDLNQAVLIDLQENLCNCCKKFEFDEFEICGFHFSQDSSKLFIGLNNDTTYIFYFSIEPDFLY